MKCVLHLEEDSSYYDCIPNECDRVGCRLNRNYDPKERIRDMDFSKPGKYSILSIIQILALISLLIAPIPYTIIKSGLTLLIIVVGMILSVSLFLFYYGVIYKTNKYWNDNYIKIRNEIEKRLSNG